MTKKLATLSDLASFTSLPLIRQRVVLARKNIERFASPELVEQTIYDLQMSFLEGLHKEIFDAKPEKEKIAIIRDRLESPEERRQFDLALEEVRESSGGAKPDLSDEYLISIGREDLVGWPPN